MNLLKLETGAYKNQGVTPMKIHTAIIGSLALALLGAVGTASAAVNVQCPGDTNGDAVIDNPDPNHPNAKCIHLIAGDSFAVMSDGNPMYTFGFAEAVDMDGNPSLPGDAILNGILDAEWPGTTIELDQGDELFLSLTNVGTVIRPDLFDPHTVHFHGFPNAASVFDGVPEVSISINMGGTLSYYYNIVEPGTYIYHCHVEASEHMEMGMLANLWVHPDQDATGINGDPATIGRRKGGAGTNEHWGYVYNDGDGTTGFDVEEAIQLSSFDPDFHDASLFVQPLPFAMLEAKYPMINGRGYPDTILPGDMPAPTDNTVAVAGHEPGKVTGTPGEILNNGTPTQTMDSVITVNQGEDLLLRLSNVSIDRFYTMTSPGLTMKIVGTGARQMRGPDGKNIYREVSSVNFGGGETHDVIIETANIAPGTYFLHSAELHQMSNLTQMMGGMITEIVVQ
jgi:FtsP/CotA-like multicopper oxidase with cupredoxin domain